MPKAALRLAISDDKEQAVIEIWENEAPIAHVILDASTLEQHIQTLGQGRSSMAERVSETLEPNARVLAIDYTNSRVARQDDGDAVALALRHHGLGWLSFELTKEQAAALGKELLDKSS